MPTKPDGWDPSNPPDKVCVFCYDPARHAFAWKYGVNWSCFRGNCLRMTKRAAGFLGAYTTKSEAESKYSTWRSEQDAKSTRKR